MERVACEKKWRDCTCIAQLEPRPPGSCLVQQRRGNTTIGRSPLQSRLRYNNARRTANSSAIAQESSYTAPGTRP